MAQAKNGEGLGAFITWMTSGEHKEGEHDILTSWHPNILTFRLKHEDINIKFQERHHLCRLHLWFSSIRSMCYREDMTYTCKGITKELEPIPNMTVQSNKKGKEFVNSLLWCNVKTGVLKYKLHSELACHCTLKKKRSSYKPALNHEEGYKGSL